MNFNYLTAINRIVRATAFMVVEEPTTHKIRMSKVNSMIMEQKGHWSDKLERLVLKVPSILQLMIPKMLFFIDHRNHFVDNFVAFMDSNKSILRVEISTLHSFAGVLAIEVLRHISIGEVVFVIHTKGQPTGSNQSSLVMLRVVVRVHHICFVAEELVVKHRTD